jgi:RND family efflux transporter MFP subunit
MSFDQNALDSLRIERNSEPPKAESSAVYKWLIIVVLALGAIAGAYALLRNPALEVETVTAMPVAAGGSSGASAVLNASGYVVARRQATVSAQVTGKVAQVNVEEGMAVKDNQVLARLEDTTLRPVYELAQRQLEAARKDLEEIQVRLAEAERSLKRTEQLRADKLVSEVQLDQAQSEVAALRARLEASRSQVRVAEGTVRVREQDLADLVVRAPFDGVVVSKDAQPGEIVSPMSSGGFTRTGIATIVDMDSREIEVDVNEAYINRVHDDQRTEAVLDAYPDWVIPSHVINVVPTADRQKATVRVRIAFDVLEPRILPQMGVKVTFLENRPEGEGTGAAQPAVRLPATAVFAQGDSKYVWRVRDEQLERVAVSTASERDGNIDIVAGINPGEVIVARQVEGLADGVAVKRAQ